MADDLENQEFLSIENREWLESLEYVLQSSGNDRVRDLLDRLRAYASRRGVDLPAAVTTAYLNSISPQEQVEYPGDLEIEGRISEILRWNAMAMVHLANKREDGIGGHISTYASVSTLFETAFHHFLQASRETGRYDQVFFQGHASPGIYARAFLEGRISKKQILNFRRELEGGVPSYPHPWLMPDFWEFPTVSMGLGSIMAIYQARFNRYLQARGLHDTSACRVWCFCGDGEMDEPESVGALGVAVREGLDNLTMIVNCNLQRLDGPVRGNGKIIQELEGVFRGAGWSVIKVIWGSAWDALLEKDVEGALARRMTQALDGDYQKYTVESADYFRRHFIGDDPALQTLFEGWSDQDIKSLQRGGHDAVKVYNAFRRAVDTQGVPTVILAKSVKGYGLGEAGEGKNVAHNTKTLTPDQVVAYRKVLNIPAPKKGPSAVEFVQPSQDSPEVRYLKARREVLGGPFPRRLVDCPALPPPADSVFAEFAKGTGDQEASTTMVLVRILAKLMRDKELGRHVVPIVPDEARTFGMEGLFSQFAIYSPRGQLYEPVDSKTLMFYKETRDGRVLEEGITEAGSMSSFIAAGTAYATHGIPTIPFYIFYSMFGFQRIGDFAWAAGDMRCRGFLIGGTAGRTTLSGEGLQHEDGHSHVLASTFPRMAAYDPAFAYELAVIIRDGLRRMYQEQEDLCYYITVGNENYRQPAMPKGVEEGILKGIYRFRKSSKKSRTKKAHLWGSGAILNEALAAADILENDYQVAADVWSVTSYKALRQDGLEVDRRNRMNPTKPLRVAHLTGLFEKETGVVVASSDYMKALPDSLARWLPLPLTSLGTDGLGRSDSRKALRGFFEVDRRFIALAALTDLARQGHVGAAVLKQAVSDLEIDLKKANPMTS